MKTRSIIILLLLSTVSALPAWAEEEAIPEVREKTSESIAVEFEYLLPLDREQIETDFIQLSRELRDSFRDFILQFPPMSSAEIESYRADFMDLNLEHYVEREVLRKQLQRARNGESTTEGITTGEIASIRTRLQGQIAEERARIARRISTPSE